MNRVCARPYPPRAQKVRTLCERMGVTWPEPEAAGEEPEGVEEEEEESEVETEDEEVEDAEGLEL